MDPHCFFRREQELYASNYSGLKDRFDPQSCVCVRFLHHRKTGEIEVLDGEFGDEGVGEWVGEGVVDGGGELRVIFAASRDDSQSNIPSWIPPIPFSQHTFYQILERCSFHRAFCDGRSPSIERSAVGDTTSIYISHKLPTCNITLWLSFHTLTASTTVLLTNCTTTEQKHIRARLQEPCLQPLTIHPILIPTLVLETIEQVITRQLRTLISRSVAGLEKVGRDLRGYEYLERNNIIETEAKAALELQIYTASINENIQLAFLTGTKLLEWSKELDMSSMTEKQAKAFGEARGIIGDRLEYFMRGMEVQMLALKRAETVINIHRQGLEVQNASIGNKLNVTISQQSRDIARGSKRDSSAMKAIAVLTMVFLPGTFLAALFAAPLFDWNGNGNGNGGSKSVVNRRFWVYWVITIPATGVVLGCWRAWYRFEEWRSWNGDGGSIGRWLWGKKRRKVIEEGKGYGDRDVEMVAGERWGNWGYEIRKEV